MMTGRYSFEAVDRDGHVGRGSMEAASPAEAVAKLRQRGLTPVRVVRDVGDNPSRVRAGRSSREMELLFGQLARLVGAGLSLDRALKTVVDGAPGTPIGTAAATALTALRSGQTPSVAMTAAGADAGAVALVRSGEVSGDLAKALVDIERLLAARNGFSRRVQAALVYPAILTLVAAGSVLTILIFVIPQFSVLVGEHTDRLSLAALMVFRLSDTLTDWGWYFAIASALLLLMGVRTVRAMSVAGFAVTLLRRLPGGAGLVTNHQAAAFLRLLGSLIERQVSLLPAIDVARSVLVDGAMVAAIEVLRSKLSAGEKLAAALAADPRFAPSVVQLALVGEETGELGQMLVRSAELLEREIDRRATVFLVWFEPCLLLAMGLIIGGLLYALFSAIFAINDLV